MTLGLLRERHETQREEHRNRKRKNTQTQTTDALTRQDGIETAIENKEPDRHSNMTRETGIKRRTNINQRTELETWKTKL